MSQSSLFAEDSPRQALSWCQNVASIQYVGSATSHFQAEPLQYDCTGKPCVSSDWEHEVIRQLRGGPSGIPKADTLSLPRFLALRAHYIDRSVRLSENMFRFSLEFPRLCPREGEFDKNLMREYARTLACIKARGQEPLLTLEHFTMPQDLTRVDRNGNICMGAWEHRDVAKRFQFYVESVVRFLSDKDTVSGILKECDITSDQQSRILSQGLAQYFITINEPAGVLYNGYLSGIFPPFKRLRVFSVLPVLKRMAEVHSMATTALKEGLRGQEHPPQVGVAYNWQFFEGLVGKIAQEFHELCTERLERGAGESDFLGLDYYFRYKFLANRTKREFGSQPSFGDVYPQGISQVLTALHRSYPSKPVFVTEFGFADGNDLRRPYWILETVRYILEAVNNGVPVKGILLWTLVNNFEWELGMSQKFGLFDESELETPLDNSDKGIRSWEAWQAAIMAIRFPNPECLGELQTCYERAKQQYRESGGKY